MQLKKIIQQLIRNNLKTQIYITEHYSTIGKIIEVYEDFIITEEELNTPNKEVIIPINQIKYIRIIK